MEESDEVLLAVFYPSDMGYDIMYYILYPINTKYISLGLSIPQQQTSYKLTSLNLILWYFQEERHSYWQAPITSIYTPNT